MNERERPTQRRSPPGTRQAGVSRRRSAAAPAGPAAATETNGTALLGQARAELARGTPTPFLLLDLAGVRRKLRRFREAMPRVQPLYAVKANPHAGILRTIAGEGAGFEVASGAELDALVALGVPPQRVFFSNPIKRRGDIERAAAAGIEWFVVDSEPELRKLAAVKPDAKLYLRIETPNIGADWPLTGKFGAAITEVRELTAVAKELGVDMAGVMFHVGSQCRNADSWRVGIENAMRAMDQLSKRGFTPRMLDIGGGFPVRYANPIPSIEAIGEVVQRALEQVPEEITVMAEPGRYLVSDAACLVARVIGTARRNSGRWIYLDTGLFHGMLEAIEGMRFEMLTDRPGAPDVSIVAGPTCDSLDVVARDQMLPEDLAEGDAVYIPNLGAYSTVYSTHFNGFEPPQVITVDGESGG